MAAMPAPMPLAPPVTSASLPCRSKTVDASLILILLARVRDGRQRPVDCGAGACDLPCLGLSRINSRFAAGGERSAGRADCQASIALQAVLNRVDPGDRKSTRLTSSH